MFIWETTEVISFEIFSVLSCSTNGNERQGMSFSQQTFESLIEKRNAWYRRKKDLVPVCRSLGPLGEMAPHLPQLTMCCR